MAKRPLTTALRGVQADDQDVRLFVNRGRLAPVQITARF
jgi:hypothetical protein